MDTNAETQPRHRLGIGGTGLTLGRIPHFSQSISRAVADELEKVMLGSDFFQGADFTWVHLSHRYGLVNEDVPHYQGISRKYRDLDLAIELDTHELRHASREELKRLFMVATLKALVHAGKKYKLPYEPFLDMLGDLTWKRLVVLTGASLTTHYRNPDTFAVQQEVMDELAVAMRDCGYLETAPFDWVNISLGFGEANDDQPHYMKIHSEYQSLVMGINLNTLELRHAPRELLKRLIAIAALKALIHAAAEFDLPAGPLEARLLCESV